jgi:hypothetical protein
MRKAMNIGLLGRNFLRILLAVRERRPAAPFSAQDVDSLLGIKHAGALAVILDSSTADVKVTEFRCESG